MKNSTKVITASLLVLGSLQANANEVELDMTKMLTQSVSNFVKQTSLELENSLKETLNFDAEVILENLIMQSESQRDSEQVDKTVIAKQD
jgi:uncharacterized protein (UPF0371 family)